jgi:PilZ domain
VSEAGNNKACAKLTGKISMESERRRAQRKTPHELTSIQIGVEGEGIVCNASEQGLSFYAVTPIQESGSLELRLSPNPNNQIALRGVVSWMDESKKFGGLQFAEYGPEVQEWIRSWLAQAPRPDAAGVELTLPVLAAAEAAQVGSQTQDILAGPEPVVPVSSESVLEPARPPFLPSAFQPDSAFREPWTSKSRSRNWLGTSLAVLLCALVLGPILLLHYFRLEVGDSLIRFGERLKGASEVRNEASLPPPVQPSSEDSSKPAVAVSQNAQISPVTSTQEAEPPAPTQDISKARLSQSQLPDNLNKPRLGGRSVAARSLWSAVGKGDVTAEVSLADLYLKGEGVPKNCEQARVLLKAAAKAGNTEAVKQLKNLKHAGCR